MNKPRTFVKFETSKLAKEKGFSNGSEHYWEQALTEKVDEQDGTSGPFGWKMGETNFQSGYFINNYKGIDYTSENWFMCEAPTQAELQKWLRDVHGINLVVNCDVKGKWYCDGFKLNCETWKAENLYASYEEALASGIIMVLNSLK